MTATKRIETGKWVARLSVCARIQYPYELNENNELSLRAKGRLNAPDGAGEFRWDLVTVATWRHGDKTPERKLSRMDGRTDA